MANVDVTVRSTDQGSQNIQNFGNKLDGLTGKALKVGASLGAMGLAFKGIEMAVRAAWQVLGEGAALDLANSRFENLAASIGTTADALKGDMADATQGMMSNAQMVASASDIISLGLADTGDEVVRLGNLVGQLGWDMQVLTLTMANDSMLRLDALGLSMEKVKTRMEELKAAGMDASEAFDLAVIEEGEAKLELLGSAADTSAGKMQMTEAAIANFTDALKLQALQLADNIGLFDALVGGIERLNQLMAATDAVRAAVEAGVISEEAGNQMIFDINRRGGSLENAAEILRGLDVALGMNTRSFEDWEAAASQLSGDELAGEFEDVARSWGKMGQSDLAAASMAKMAGTMDETADATNRTAVALDKAAIKAALLGSAMKGFTGIGPAEMEAQRAAAEELAQMYEEAARRMGQAFAGFANDPATLPDFGDTDAMNDMAWDMAAAFGLTVEQAGNLGIALGTITPEMAEAAAKAVIFQEAFGNLLGQLQAGNLDTAGFVAAYDALIADLNSKSLVEIQVELKQKTNPARDLWAWLPAEERVKEIEVPVKFTPEEAALNTALGLIDGIPDDQTKLITFDAEYAAVTPDATDAIETAITAIDATVLMTPEAQEVYNVIELLDESRLTIYVDYVNNGAPELPEKAAGGSVASDRAYWVGERGPEIFVPWTSGTIVPNHQLGGGGMQLSVQNYFYGPTNAAEVGKASESAGRRLLELVRQAGVPT